MDQLRFRQVHLDFHTSEHIKGIGTEFSKEQFQRALQKGHVDSITIFSKCHHGWAYHPSEANEIHPNITFDLLKEMIDAAHEIDVKTPVYISAGLDEKIARKHTDWLFRNQDESTTWATRFDVPSYHLFCFNSPYLDVLLAQIEEVVKNYDADGIFLDIVKPKPCYCQNCVQAIMEEGNDPYDEKVSMEYGERVYANYTKRVRETIDLYKKDLPVFHNGGHISKGRKDLAFMNTHLELESLPTGGWGYDHFPSSVRYVQNLGVEYLGMTGKFHTTWGEFGGFKHPNALKYETALSIANGAKCSIGDQLHPSGLMDELTYDIIGQAYSEVEEKEEWCRNVTSIADVAILASEAVLESGSNKKEDLSLADTGAVRVLLQEHILFDIVDLDMKFDKYKVIILPDVIRITDVIKEKLEDFIKKGGKILATGESGMYEESNEFAFDFGVEWECKCENKPSFFQPEVEIEVFNGSSFVFYSEAETVKVTNGNVKGYKQSSYFNRAWNHFCSHQHAPNSMERDGVGMVESQCGIYIPWKLFTEYSTYGNIPVRKVLKYALKSLLCGTEIIQTNLPSQGIVTMMKQEKRDIIHLLYGTPIKRGTNPTTNKSIEVIEDLVPLYHTNVTINRSEKINKIYLAPQMEELEFVEKDGKVEVIVEKFICHQMLVVE